MDEVESAATTRVRCAFIIHTQNNQRIIAGVQVLTQSIQNTVQLIPESRLTLRVCEWCGCRLQSEIFYTRFLGVIRRVIRFLTDSMSADV